MAEYVDRDAAYKVFCAQMQLTNLDHHKRLLIKAQEAFLELPAVEVVRCKDCVYSCPTLDGRAICSAMTNPNFVNEQHFCSYGERRADDGRDK